MNLPSKLTKNWLYKNYPWLKISTALEDYISPDYYDKLLKPYIFNKKEDLEYLRDVLKYLPKNLKVLELGCGTGRSTVTLLEIKDKIKDVTGVDLSKNMVNKSKSKFKNYKQIMNFVKSDTLKFVGETFEKYDFIFSLWNLSHSIHQNMEFKGVKDGFTYAYNVLYKFFTQNIKKGGIFFLIHFDSLSEEQIILRRILRRINPLYFQNKKQSLSKKVIDLLVKDLYKSKKFRIDVKHLIGEPIIYPNLNNALETFMNFHLESYFNNKDMLVDVFKELQNYLIRFKDKKNRVIIKPSCFIYTIEKK